MTTARTATPSTARAINDRLALDLLLERGPLTASDLRTLTGLSRPTVADLLERLQRSGLVAHAGESAALRRGPNARLYGLVADRAHLAGIDIRSNGVSLVVADLTGRTLGTATIAAFAPAPGRGEASGAAAVEGPGAAAGAGSGADAGPPRLPVTVATRSAAGSNATCPKDRPPGGLETPRCSSSRCTPYAVSHE